MEDMLLTFINSAGGLTPAIMAYFMFKQNQLLIHQKDKHEQELMLIVRELITETRRTKN